MDFGGVFQGGCKWRETSWWLFQEYCQTLSRSDAASRERSVQIVRPSRFAGNGTRFHSFAVPKGWLYDVRSSSAEMPGFNLSKHNGNMESKVVKHQLLEQLVQCWKKRHALDNLADLADKVSWPPKAMASRWGCKYGVNGWCSPTGSQLKDWIHCCGSFANRPMTNSVQLKWTERPSPRQVHVCDRKEKVVKVKVSDQPQILVISC